MVPQQGRARFGYGLAWVEAEVEEGAPCAPPTFGNDPIPGVMKTCQCSTAPDQAVGGGQRDDLGQFWERCADEDASCKCAAGSSIRFGSGSRWLVSDSGRKTDNLVCSAASFAGDPFIGERKECWCEKPPKKQKPGDRVAIVLVSRKAPDIATWLKYHLGYVGVDHVFIQVEDSAGFSTALEGLSPARRAQVTFWTDAQEEVQAADQTDVGKRPKDDYSSLQARQVATMQRARKLAHKQGIQWLVHIDDDEILYVPTHRKVGDVLAAVPSMYKQVYVPNVEAVYPNDGIKDCFAETKEVNTNPYAFASYANGKSGVRVGNPDTDDLVPAGPHQWKSASGLELSSVHLDQEPFGAPFVVVHFESCPFERWEDKFWELGNTSPEKVRSIPFPFYRDSIQRFMQCGSHAQKAGSTSKVSSECSDISLRALWSSVKTRKNKAIRQQDVMPINIPWKAIQAESL